MWWIIFVGLVVLVATVVTVVLVRQPRRPSAPPPQPILSRAAPQVSREDPPQVAPRVDPQVPLSTQAAVCAIVKNEEPYLNEWVTYYLDGLGFDAVHLYDNSDANVLQGFFTDERVHIHHWPGGQQQIPAYQDMLDHYRCYRWCAFVDADEFVVIPPPYDIHTFLETHCAQGGLVLNWRLFGDNGLTEPTADPVTQRFRRRQGGYNHLVKTLCVMADATRPRDPHTFLYREGTGMKDILGVPVEESVHGLDWVDQPPVPAWIAHYFGKTRAEFAAKRARGRADGGDIRSLEVFDIHNFNDEADDSAYVIYQHAIKVQADRTAAHP